MIDLMQADRSLRAYEKTPALYSVVTDRGLVLGVNLDWIAANRLTMAHYFNSKMVRTN